ncbi:MAG: leucine-rich repeat domain-containing protein, partial [Anaeroplasmataceae bacterium]|nr:leucine-rich repeat domain-containing protein [Anaeroplasmataceae bacterium]
MISVVNKFLKKGKISIVCVLFGLLLLILAKPQSVYASDVSDELTEEATEVVVEETNESSTRNPLRAIGGHGHWYRPGSTWSSFYANQSEVHMLTPNGYDWYDNQSGTITSFNDYNNDGKITVQSSYLRASDGNTLVITVGDQDNPVSFQNTVKEITFPSTLTTVSSNAFKNRTNIEMIDLSKTNVTYIGDSAFEGCTNLKEIRLPNTLKTIGARAFKGCTNLVSKFDITKYNNGIINLSSVTSIGANAFEDDVNLIFITFGNQLTTLGANAFKNCINVEQVALPASITTLGKGVFYGCTTMHTANVLTNILSEGLFEQCTSLNNVLLNDNIKVIPKEAFKHASCSSINLPSALTKICYGAFEGSSINDFT